jgi:hypothetical protein
MYASFRPGELWVAIQRITIVPCAAVMTGGLTPGLIIRWTGQPGASQRHGQTPGTADFSPDREFRATAPGDRVMDMRIAPAP